MNHCHSWPIKQLANGNKTEDTNRVIGMASHSCKTQWQKCLNCEKTIRRNQKQISCCVCFSLYHIKCVDVAEPFHTDLSCSNCLMSHLLFFKCSTEEILDNDYGHQSLSPQVNPLKFSDPSDIAATLPNRPSNLWVMHFNAQSMVSIFNDFLLTVNSIYHHPWWNMVKGQSIVDGISHHSRIQHWVPQSRHHKKWRSQCKHKGHNQMQA